MKRYNSLLVRYDWAMEMAYVEMAAGTRQLLAEMMAEMDRSRIVFENPRTDGQ